MRRALIGHTGFVGARLTAGGAFTDLFNSANIDDIAGNGFDEIRITPSQPASPPRS
jgi:hypothetical protein